MKITFEDNKGNIFIYNDEEYGFISNLTYDTDEEFFNSDEVYLWAINNDFRNLIKITNIRNICLETYNNLKDNDYFKDNLRSAVLKINNFIGKKYILNNEMYDNLELTIISIE